MGKIIVLGCQQIGIKKNVLVTFSMLLPYSKLSYSALCFNRISMMNEFNVDNSFSNYEGNCYALCKGLCVLSHHFLFHVVTFHEIVRVVKWADCFIV